MEHRYNCEMFHDSFFVVAGRLLFTPVSITPLTARSMNNNLKKYLKYTCRGYILIIRKYTPRGLYNRRNTMEEKKVCPGCCHKTKDRPEKEYKDLMNRLSRIEGQVRGV